MTVDASQTFADDFEHHAPALFAWTCLRMPFDLRGQIEPQEVVHEVWVRAQAAFAKFDRERASFKTWLIGIAKNVLLEASRRSRRSARLPEGPTTGLFALENYPESVTSISRRLVRDESVGRFLEHVRTLDEESQRMIALCGLEGLPVKEAAVRLDLSHDAALKRWQRLRQRLSETGLGVD